MTIFIHVLIPQMRRHPFGMQEELPPALPLKLKFKFRSFHQVAFLLTWQGICLSCLSDLSSQVTNRSSIKSEPHPCACISHPVPCPHQSGWGKEYSTVEMQKEPISGATIPVCSQVCVRPHMASLYLLPPDSTGLKF